jgi:valyl-tRNA synthetase
MMMLGLRFMGDVPFRDVFMTALVRDYEGKKMSKSSGNVIDPIDIIEVYGTDALRFTLASIAVPGRDINLSEERIAGNRNFVNKIWNAARLVIMNLEGFDPAEGAPEPGDLELADRWIMSRLSSVIERADSGMEAFNFSVAGKALHQFFWGDFCDWYLELAKLRLYRGEPGRKRAAQWVAWRVLECALRLLHPFMPFVTEELWQRLPGAGESVMKAEWPSSADFDRDAAAEGEMELVQSVTVGIRAARSEHGIPPGSKLDAVLVCAPRAREVLERQGAYLETLSGLSGMRFAERPPDGGFGMRVVVEGAEAYLAAEQGVNAAEEIDRLARKLAKVEADLERCTAKLASEGFLAKAPAEVVEKEREKETELREQRDKLSAQISAL